MVVYSALLTLGLTLSAPWWVWRMLTSGRYRAGLGQRLGLVSRELKAAVAGKPVVWVHAVSVGEVLAAQRLVAELGAALPGYCVVVSTTTETGQELARTRLGVPVFYLPLDFAWAVRAYLNVLRPRLLVLMESELWPRLLVECERRGVPVAVANARVSDRSFPRYMRLRWLWRPLLGKVRVFLAQSEETAERLRAMGVDAGRVRCLGNLKYDIGEVVESSITAWIKRARGASRVIVAGSTLEGEEAMLLEAWPRVLRGSPDLILVIAPRHPQRFDAVWEMLQGSGFESRRCSSFNSRDEKLEGGTILLLDTIGDLASVYSVASSAFIGGSLVPKGGHNPLEAARFCVPIVMGKSYENFREIVKGMDSIRLIEPDQLAEALISSPRYSQNYARRGFEFFLSQSGATARTVEALLGLIAERGV